MRKFTGQYQIEINIRGDEYPLQRENDKYIMEIAKDAGLSLFELRFLNHWRLYLNVISVSDVVNESGQYLDPMVTNYKNCREEFSCFHAIKTSLTTPNGQFGLNSLARSLQHDRIC